MSVPVLTTTPGSEHVEVSGLPLLPADGRGGVPLERAAAVLPQLQDADGKPLSGAALNSAAEALAEDHNLRITQVSEAKVAKLPQLAGAYPDRPPAVETAQGNYEQLYGPLEEDAPGTPEQDLTPEPETPEPGTPETPASASDNKEG